MENKVSSGPFVQTIGVRLLYILLITVFGVSTSTRDWTAANLLTNLMIGATWLALGILLVMGRRTALLSLGISFFVLIGLKILIDVSGAWVDGRWDEVFLLIFCLAFLVLPSFLFLLTSKWCETEVRTTSDQESSDLPPQDS